MPRRCYPGLHRSKLRAVQARYSGVEDRIWTAAGFWPTRSAQTVPFIKMWMGFTNQIQRRVKQKSSKRYEFSGWDEALALESGVIQQKA